MLTFLRTKVLPHRATQLLIKTVTKWQKDRCLEMGAALSYYALFSLFPILLVIASILGFLLGPETNVYQKILTFTQNSLPPEAFTIVRDTLLQLNQESLQAGIIGFFLTLFAASNVFGALDRSVDKIWKVTAHESKSMLATTISLVTKKLWAFGLVVSTAGLLLLSLLSNIAVRVLVQIISTMNSNIPMIELDDLIVARLLQASSSFLLLALGVLLLLRFLPSTVILWRDLWPGTLLTTSLLLVLQQTVSNNIIQIGANHRSYGVIGSVMILLLWLYLTCQIFLLGCEFSYVYTYLFGSRRNRSLKL